MPENSFRSFASSASEDHAGAAVKSHEPAVSKRHGLIIVVNAATGASRVGFTIDVKVKREEEPTNRGNGSWLPLPVTPPREPPSPVAPFSPFFEPQWLHSITSLRIGNGEADTGARRHPIGKRHDVTVETSLRRDTRRRFNDTPRRESQLPLRLICL